MSEKMDELKNALVKHLLGVEGEIEARGLHMPSVTLLVRDPEVPGMVVSVSNDPDLRGAFRQLMKNGRETEVRDR